MLEDTIEDLDDREVGAARSETRSVKGRTFELWTDVVASAPGTTRDAGTKLGGVRSFVGEEAAIVATTDAIQVTCSHCGASPSHIPATRDFACEFCQATSLIADRVWQRLHPEAAIKTWFMVVPADDDDEPKVEAQPTFAMGDDLIAVDDGAVAAVTFGTTSAIVRLDGKLAVRWRVDLAADHGTLRLVRVDAEVWVADTSKHVAARYALEDGRSLGTIGEVEPVGAKLSSFDLRGLGDWALLADGSVMTLLCNRFRRYRKDGSPLDTWPKKGGVLLGWLFNADPVALYQGPPVTDDGDDLDPPRKHGRLVNDELGATRPYTSKLVYRRFAADASSLWIDTGAVIHRYGLDGKRLCTVEVPRGGEVASVRPVVDGKGGLYSVVYDDDSDSHAIAYTDGTTCRLFATKAVGFPKALMLHRDGGLWIFGTQDGDVRHVDASGNLGDSSRGAIRADRWADDADDEEVA